MHTLPFKPPSSLATYEAGIWACRAGERKEILQRTVLPQEAHESPNVTHTSSVFSGPPVPLIAHLNIFSAYPLILTCLRKKARKDYIPAFSLCFERTPLPPGDTSKQVVKWGRSICSFLPGEQGESTGAGVLTPFLTLGVGPSASFWVSNHLRRYWSRAPSGPSAKHKCLC